ncbi:MAG TPA: PPOX class F420-dependent oxidoreductase [Actinomycetota bacterium]|nr:PPOX class F420-dependent oxidoreductase [Actinomycetota bacterium]
MTLTPEQAALFHEPNWGVLATLMGDGSPQATILWVDERDGLIWVNTAEGRTKPRNVRRDPRVAVTVWDRNEPLRWVQVRGRVEEMTQDGAVDHINALSHKYDGEDFALPEGQIRVILKIRPEQVSSSV